MWQAKAPAPKTLSAGTVESTRHVFKVRSGEPLKITHKR